MAKTLVIEQWPVERLLPYVANARAHPEAQITQIANSIAAFGFNVPCLVDENDVLIAGHGRLLAAKRLGFAEIPVIRLDHLTDAQARAFRIADNQISLNAEWDLSTLSLELGALREAGLDLGLLGFSLGELSGLLEPRTGLTDPDASPSRRPPQPRKRATFGFSALTGWYAATAPIRRRGLFGAGKAASYGDRSALRRGIRS